MYCYATVWVAHVCRLQSAVGVDEKVWRQPQLLFLSRPEMSLLYKHEIITVHPLNELV